MWDLELKTWDLKLRGTEIKDLGSQIKSLGPKVEVLDLKVKLIKRTLGCTQDFFLERNTYQCYGPRLPVYFWYSVPEMDFKLTLVII